MRKYAKTPVGAHYGAGNWLLQRMTGLVMALYTVGLAVALLWNPPASHAEWRGLFAGTFARVATMLFFVALLYHAWIGMRDILMDYVKPMGVRLALESAVAIVLVVYLIWSASILFGGRP